MNMPQYIGSYAARTFTTAETTVVTTRDANVVGVLCCSTGTGVITLYAGVTATTSTLLAGPVRIYTTVPAAYINGPVWMPVPGIAMGGLIVTIGASNDPNITLFWNPA